MHFVQEMNKKLALKSQYSDNYNLYRKVAKILGIACYRKHALKIKQWFLNKFQILFLHQRLKCVEPSEL
jgi:hypothetical protein